MVFNPFTASNAILALKEALYKRRDRETEKPFKIIQSKGLVNPITDNYA